MCCALRSLLVGGLVLLRCRQAATVPAAELFLVVLHVCCKCKAWPWVCMCHWDMQGAGGTVFLTDHGWRVRFVY